MSDPITLGGVAILAISNIGIWIDKIKSSRGNGKADKTLCLEHQNRIAKVEAGQQFLVDFKKENHKEHLQIFTALGKKRR